MAVKTVQTVINGQTYTLTLNSSTGKYEATITAPSKSSYNQSGHYYGVTVKATDDAGNTSSKDAADSTLGNSLQLKVGRKLLQHLQSHRQPQAAILLTVSLRLHLP